MKTLLLTVLLLFAAHLSHAQEAPPTTLFAQCLIQIDSQESLDNLNESLHANPYIKIVRLDWLTKRVFVLTKDLESLDAESFRSWFGEYGDGLSCLQIGVYGIDRMNAFPFTNCEH
jgi:hypothetical protein